MSEPVDRFIADRSVGTADVSNRSGPSRTGIA